MASTTNHSVFEALFDRRLEPRGAFAAELRLAGYDPATAVPTYPTEVWSRCLEVARRQLWPHLSVPDAYRKLGSELAEGFLETLVGRMVGVAIPFMTPRTFVRRLASYLRLGRNDEGLIVQLNCDEPSISEVTVHNPSRVPGALLAGIIDAALTRMKVRWTVEVEQRSPQDYHVSVRWTK